MEKASNVYRILKEDISDINTNLLDTIELKFLIASVIRFLTFSALFLLGIPSRLDSSREVLIDVVLGVVIHSTSEANSLVISPATDCKCCFPCKCSLLLCKL